MNTITEEFLRTQESIYTLSKKYHVSSEEIINQLKEDGFLYANKKAYRFFKYLYKNSKIYLERKYTRFARYHSNMIDERDEIGESCDANPELTN